MRCAAAATTTRARGWPSALAGSTARPRCGEYARLSDLVRLGLAGTLASYRLIDASGQPVTGAQMRYGGSPARASATQPSEVVNYAENHDNQTLFDINVYRLPPDTSREDRARVQHLASAVVAPARAWPTSTPAGHPAQQEPRSQQLRLGRPLQPPSTGAPPTTALAPGCRRLRTTRHDWPWMKPAGRRAHQARRRRDAWTHDAFADLLRIRASSTLFRLRTADEVQRRLSLAARRAAAPDAALVALQLDGRGLPGAASARVVVLINAATGPRTLTVPTLAGQPLVLHQCTGCRAQTSAPRQPSTRAPALRGAGAHRGGVRRRMTTGTSSSMHPRRQRVSAAPAPPPRCRPSCGRCAC